MRESACPPTVTSMKYSPSRGKLPRSGVVGSIASEAGAMPEFIAGRCVNGKRMAGCAAEQTITKTVAVRKRSASILQQPADQAASTVAFRDFYVYFVTSCLLCGARYEREQQLLGKSGCVQEVA